MLIRLLAPVAQDPEVVVAEHVVAAARLVDLAVLEQQRTQGLGVEEVPTPIHLLPHGPEAAFLDDKLLEAPLGVGGHEEGLLDGGPCGEAVDDDGPRLPDAVAPVLGLEVLLRVEVGVEQDDRVGGGEVDALPARAGGEEEDAVRRVVVEVVDLVAAALLGDGAVDAADVPAAELPAVVLEDVELGGELREDQDLVVVLE